MPVGSRLLFLASFVALVSPAVPVALEAQSASFDVALRGQSVGTASYRFRSTPAGIASESSVRVAAQDVEYAFSKSEQLTATHKLKSAEINAVVGGQAVHLTATVQDAAIQLKASANGRTTSSALVAHGAAVFLPDFDPGALQTLLNLAAARNGVDLWLVIPRQAGSVVPVKIATYADEQGTLDGRATVVHHLVASSEGGTMNLFAGADHQLLQAELPQAGFALVRKGFVLTPPSHAPAPPPAEDSGAPAANQQPQ